MPKTREQKEEILKKLTKDLQEAKSATLTTFSQVPVKLDQQLREDFYKEEVSYSVVKKTLLRKIFEQLGYKEIEVDNLKGNISLAISRKDEVAPAKIANQFAQDNEGLDLVGGILENKWIDKEEVLALAKLPNKEELITKTVGTIKAPLNGLVNVLAGNLRGLVNVLNAVKEQKT